MSLYYGAVTPLLYACFNGHAADGGVARAAVALALRMATESAPLLAAHAPLARGARARVVQRGAQAVDELHLQRAEELQPH